MFIDNIKIILSEEYCTIKEVGILAYLPFGYKKYMNELEEKAKIKPAVYFGEIGKRYKDIAVTLSTLAYYDTQYGTTYIYKMVDADDHIFIWRTANFFESGDYNCTMSIKDHKEYQGTKQAEVTRCKVAKR